jgi:predicted nucleic acid-binding protein
MLLLDTNLLSSDRVEENDLRNSGPLFTSSVSAQELLGMQKPDSEMGYRYALPAIDERTHGPGRGAPADMLVRWLSDHAKRWPVSKQTDRLVVPRSRLRHESLELGHLAVAAAHGGGYDGLFRAYASRGLHRRMLKPVLGKWEFLRREIEGVIPLDDEIATQAVSLADRFVEAGLHVKGTRRNTLNDMLVAATSHITGLPLATADAQLGTFYLGLGWSVKDGTAARIGDMLVTRPVWPVWS